MDVNLIHKGVHHFFHSFSQTGKVVEELLEFKYLFLLKLELNFLHGLIFSFLRVMQQERNASVINLNSVTLLAPGLLKQGPLNVVKVAL